MSSSTSGPSPKRLETPSMRTAGAGGGAAPGTGVTLSKLGPSRLGARGPPGAAPPRVATCARRGPCEPGGGHGLCPRRGLRPRRARRPRASSSPLSRRRSKSPSIEPSFCVPASRPFSTSVSNVSACGSTEKVTCSSARCDDGVGERLARLGLDRAVDDGRRLVGVVGDPLHGGDVALEQVARRRPGAPRGTRRAPAARWSGTRRPPRGRPRRRARARRHRGSAARPTARAARRRRGRPAGRA